MGLQGLKENQLLEEWVLRGESYRNDDDDDDEDEEEGLSFLVVLGPRSVRRRRRVWISKIDRLLETIPKTQGDCLGELLMCGRWWGRVSGGLSRFRLLVLQFRVFQESCGVSWYRRLHDQDSLRHFYLSSYYHDIYIYTHTKRERERERETERHVIRVSRARKRTCMRRLL